MKKKTVDAEKTKITVTLGGKSSE